MSVHVQRVRRETASRFAIPAYSLLSGAAAAAYRCGRISSRSLSSLPACSSFRGELMPAAASASTTSTPIGTRRSAPPRTAATFSFQCPSSRLHSIPCHADDPIFLASVPSLHHNVDSKQEESKVWRMVERERGGGGGGGGRGEVGEERRGDDPKGREGLPVATKVSAATPLLFLPSLVFFSFSREERKSPEARLRGPTTRRVVKTVD